MEPNRSLEIKVGIVSVLAVVTLIVGIALGKGITLSVSGYEVSMRFANSGGIQTGAPVLINGVKSGAVTSVETDGSSAIIKANLDKISDLRSDASAKITMLEITGGRKIELKPGNSDVSFDQNAVIPGETAADIADLIALAGDASSRLEVLLVRFDTISAAFTELLAKRQLMSDVETTLENTRDLTVSLNQFFNDNSGKIASSLNNLESISNELDDAVKKNRPDLERIVAKTEKTLDDSKTLVENTNRVVVKADRLIDNLNFFADSLKNSDGFVSKALYDENFSRKIDSSFTELIDFVRHIKKYGVNINARIGTRP